MDSIIGARFHRWTVLERYLEQPPKRNSKWLCRCECGTTKLVALPNLKHGISKSCGCLNREVLDAKSKNAVSKLNEYWIWTNMHVRCYKTNNQAYKNYGGRGIGVCDRWNKTNPNGFENFLADMGTRPTTNHSIERKENHIGYSPENCIWADAATQARNRRTTKWLTFDGRTKCQKDWAIELGISEQTILQRLRDGELFESICASVILEAA